MNLQQAQEQLEALPGVYEVNTFVGRSHPDARPEGVKFTIHCRSPEILPEQTRLGILGVRDVLERELGCLVSIIVSAGLPDSG